MAAAATAAAQDEGEKEVHLGVVHCAPKCHCKLLIQMTVTLADGSVLEADGDLLLVFSSSSSFLILLVLVAAKPSEKCHLCHLCVVDGCQRQQTKIIGRFNTARRL